MLHYQPKIDLASGRMSGLEALIRWNDPDTGLVPPVQFIPLLEETGLIRNSPPTDSRNSEAPTPAWSALSCDACRKPS